MGVIATERHGEINTAFIKWIKNRRRLNVADNARLREKWETIIVDNKDNEYVVPPYEDSSLQKFRDEFSEVIIPAIQPMRVISVWGVDDKEGPMIDYYPIVAWQVSTAGYPYPVAPGCPAADELRSNYFIELPSGKFLQCCFEGSEFDTLEAAIEYIRQEQQGRKYGKVETAATE